MKATELRYQSILPDLSSHLKKIKEISGGSSDLLINEIEICGIRTALICCEGMVSTSTMTELILHPLMNLKLDNPSPAALFNKIENRMLLSVDRPVAYNYEDFFRLLNSGFAMLAADGQDSVLAFGVQGYDKRGVDEPSGENNITGSHDGFVEVIRSNMSLIRRRMKSPVLVQKLFVMGDKSQTDMCICYMSDRVPKKLIEKIMTSIEKRILNRFCPQAIYSRL